MNEEIKKLIEAFEISAEFKFVPFSKSRHCVNASKKWYEKPNWGSLNWNVTLKVGGFSTLIREYAQGIAHVPGYSHTNRMTMHEAGVLSEAIERGSVPPHHPPKVAKIGKIPEPTTDEVYTAFCQMDRQTSTQCRLKNGAGSMDTRKTL